MAGRSALLLAATVALCIGYTSATTWAELAPYRKQWNITVATSPDQYSEFTRLEACNKTALKDPCNGPIIREQEGGRVKVTVALKPANGSAALVTVNGLQPVKAVIKSCYSKPYTVERAWRAQVAGSIQKSKNCPQTMGAFYFDGSNVTEKTIIYNLRDNTTEATWYVAVFVQCQNGSTLSPCQWDSTANSTYYPTTTDDQVTTSILVSAIVCSTLAPLFLAGYFLKDYMWMRSQRKAATATIH